MAETPEELCDKLDTLNTISHPQECADAMDRARTLIIKQAAEIAKLTASGERWFSWALEQQALRLVAEAGREKWKDRAEAAEARLLVSEDDAATAAGWALCDHAKGAGPAGCNLGSCACGAEGAVAAKAVLALIKNGVHENGA